jgi:hypothetical protein
MRAAMNEIAPGKAAAQMTPAELSQSAMRANQIKNEASGPVRDSFGAASRRVLASSRADYQALDKASGGRWQRFDDQIKNIQRKMDEVNGIDDDAYANLEVKRNDIETSQAQMIEDMKAKGEVDPAIADRAVAKYRQAMALRDINAAVQASTKSVAVGGAVTPVTDPNMLARRLDKLGDVPPDGGASRLEQALGKKGAAELIEHVQNAQLSSIPIKELDPMTLTSGPTGQNALRAIIRKNTTPKGSLLRAPGAQIDWNGAFRDFEKYTPEAQGNMFGADVDRVRGYLSRQMAKQNAMRLLKKALPYAGAAAIGGEAAKTIF